MTLTKNIFYSSKESILMSYSGALTSSDNVVWGEGATWSGADALTGTLTVDPQFKDAANGDFTPQNAEVIAVGAGAAQ